MRPRSNIKKSQEIRRKEKQRHRSLCSESICTKVKQPRPLNPCEQVASWNHHCVLCQYLVLCSCVIAFLVTFTYLFQHLVW
ncbi:unnamed protein product [Eretmochelys imbricata]